MYSGQQLAPTTINDLPKEIKQLIASFLINHDPLQAIQDILKLQKISKEWNQIAMSRLVMSHLRGLWEQKVKEGWVDNFLKQEQDIKFRRRLWQLYRTHKTLNLKELIAERDRATLSLRTTGIRADRVLTHLVIRKKIEILAILMANSGIDVPDSLQNFPALPPENKSESEMELAMLEIERMAGGKNKKKMTADQKSQIIAAIEECLRSKEHKRGARNSTQQVHQEGFARRKSEKWNRAQRIFQSSGFAAALNDAERC
jgi:hypothetical protein